MQSRSIEPRSQMDVPRSMMSKHLWDSGNSYWHQGEKASTYFSCSSSSSHVSLTLLDLLCASNAFEFLTTSNPSWSRSRMDWLQKGRHCSRSFCEAFTSRSRFCEAFTSRFRFSACNRTSGCQTYVSQQTSSSLSARHLKTHTHHKSTAKASKTNSAVPMSLATLVTIYRIMGNTHNCDRVVPHSLKLTCTGLTGRTWGRFLCQLPWRA